MFRPLKWRANWTSVAHLGTIDVYGYGTAGMKIPDGYCKVKVEVEGGRLVDNEILYPAKCIAVAQAGQCARS